MCDPVTLTSIALMAGSVGANMIGQNKVQGERDDAMAAERIRQKKLDDEAASLQVASQDRYKDFQGKTDERAGGLTDLYRQTQESVVGAPAPMAAAPGGNEQSVVAREAAKQAGKTADFNNQQATALGDVSAFGDLLGDNSRAQARDATMIGQLGNFKKGSSQALSYELEAAQDKGAPFKLAGDIMGGLGSLGAMYGLRGPMTLAGKVGAPAIGAPMQLAGAVSRPFSLY